MKKGILILLGICMMVSTVEAKNGNYLSNSTTGLYAYENAVNFIENNIEFYVFTNGDFDYNTDYNRNARFSNGRFNAVIVRDFRGRVRRIGNVAINYNFRGNVSRIGNISMRYFRNRLTDVGNLNVRYNNWGNPIFYGNVRDNYYYDNGIRVNLNIGAVCNFNDAYFFRNDFRRNYTQVREDNRFYYYKANRNAKIGKRNKILKRRKKSSSTSRRSTTQNQGRVASFKEKNAYRNTASKPTRASNTNRNYNAKVRRNNSKSTQKEENSSTKKNRANRARGKAIKLRKRATDNKKLKRTRSN